MATAGVKIPENKGLKRRKENENVSEVSDATPSEAKDSAIQSEKSVSFYNVEAMEKILNDMNKQVNQLLSTYAQMLRQVNMNLQLIYNVFGLVCIKYCIYK
ncbi:testis-expressed protein 12 [Protopterus annectens]|uniref:testis-expressed protein 12 n=1 Tax=Protopterus annectens TaxID=7888 RepID=UPI001CF9376C|nr:testis-expressed protein 12 [Protopterus annectens]